MSPTATAVEPRTSDTWKKSASESLRKKTKKTESRQFPRNRIVGKADHFRTISIEIWRETIIISEFQMSQQTRETGRASVCECFKLRSAISPEIFALKKIKISHLVFGDRSICSLALSLASSSMSPSRTAVPRLEDIPLTRPKPTCSREGARSEGRRHRSQAEKRASKWADWEWSTTYNRREGPYLKAEEVVGCIIFFVAGTRFF